MRDLWIRRFSSLLLGGLVGVYASESAGWLLLGLFLLVGIRIILWKPRDFFAPSYRPEIWVLTGGILAGLLYGFGAHKDLEAPLLLSRVTIVGELRDWQINEDGGKGLLRIKEPLPIGETENSVDFVGKSYRLSVYPKASDMLPEGWKGLQAGDVVRFTAKLEHPKGPGTEGQFDLPLYYRVRGLSGSLTGLGEAELITEGKPSFSWQVRTRVRQLLGAISSGQGDRDQTGVLEGILFGDISRIPQADLERYRITGVYHVFSASGANVAFLLLLCWGATGFLPRLWRVGFCILALIFYALLCGNNPPILRATIMMIFILLGRLSEGRSNALRGLFAAGLLLFIWQPLYLRDVGFQLSFLAAWGLIVLSPYFIERMGRFSWPQSIKGALAASLAAQAAALPLLITTFHRLSLIGLVANLLVLFILGSVFELGIIGVALGMVFPPAALVLFQTSLWLLAAVNAVLFQLALLPGADFWAVNPGPLFWFLWYGSLAVLLFGRERVVFIAQVLWLNQKKRSEPMGQFLRSNLGKWLPAGWLSGIRSGWAALLGLGLNGKEVWGSSPLRLVFVVLLGLLLWSPWNTPRALELTFLDVGQGDAILIETPGGKRLLIDAGPKSERFDAGERVILPYLLNRGIRHLDGLFLTHRHDDHVGGAEALLQALPCDWVGIPEDGEDWLSQGNWPQEGQRGAGYPGSSGGETEKAELEPGLVKVLAGKKREKLRAGDYLSLDHDIRMEVLAPIEPLEGTRSDENNNSLVLRLVTGGGQKVLLTGDMEEEEMAAIRVSGQDYSADILKIPHHGSRFSLDTDWLDRVEAKAVIISVGKNRFGHPHPSVLSYWQERHVPVYRTDEGGTIRVRMDDRGIEVIPGRSNVFGNQIK